MPASLSAAARSVPVLAAQSSRMPLEMAGRALWLLPIYAALLALSTLTHQPDAPGRSRVAACLPLFVVSGLVLPIVQPIAAAAFVIVTVVLARRLPTAVS